MLYQKFRLQLDLTSSTETPLNLSVMFKLPEQIETTSQINFTQTLFPEAAARFSVEAQVNAVGNYSLQVSVYQRGAAEPGQADQLVIIRHFFVYIGVTESKSEVSNFPFPFTSEFPLTGIAMFFQGAGEDIINVRGQIVYFDDNVLKELPVRQLKVIFLEENVFSGDRQIATTFTDDNGRYEFLRLENFDPEDGTKRDIYLRVEFENEIVRIRDPRNLLYRSNSQTLMNVPNGDINFDQVIGKDNQLRGLGAILNNFKDAYDFMLKTANWKRQKLDVKWPAEQNTSNYLYISDELTGRVIDEIINIAPGDEWNRQAIVHEYGHSVMTAGYANANRLPQSETIPIHFIYTVSNSQFAMLEGWAAFYEAAVDNNAFNVTAFRNLKTPNIEVNDWWTGKSDGTGPNTKGELVEGTVASILWDIFDTPQSIDQTPNADDDEIFMMFPQIWQVITKAFPKDIIQLADSWKELNFGKLSELENIYSKHHVKVNLTKPWDVNIDRIVDIFDLVLVASHINRQPEPGFSFNLDVNGDGVIDIFDISLIAAHFGETL